MRNVVKNAFLGLLLAVMCVAALAGIAAAVWSSMGAGQASASVDTTVAVTLSPAVPAAELYPGGTTDVVLTITNTNSAAVRIGSLSSDPTRGTTGFAADSDHSGCALSALAFTRQTNGTTGWTVPGKTGSTDGTLAVTLTDALSMSTSAVNACQGATFTVYLLAKP